MARRLTGDRRRELVRLVAARDGLECHYCRQLLLEGSATVEHVFPVAWGGGNDAWNVRLACEPCNRAAGDFLVKCPCAGCSRALWVALWRLGWSQGRTKPHRGRDVTALAAALGWGSVPPAATSCP